MMILDSVLLSRSGTGDFNTASIMEKEKLARRKKSVESSN
jgi:hypothetical protein